MVIVEAAPGDPPAHHLAGSLGVGLAGVPDFERGGITLRS
jgi:hypothetical protein